MMERFFLSRRPLELRRGPSYGHEDFCLNFALKSVSGSLGGILFSANACRACIRTRANTGPANYLCIGFVPLLIVFRIKSLLPDSNLG